MVQESMFLKTVLEDVIGVPGELTSAGYQCEWRMKKDKLESKGSNLDRVGMESKTVTVQRVHRDLWSCTPEPHIAFCPFLSSHFFRV